MKNILASVALVLVLTLSTATPLQAAEVPAKALSAERKEALLLELKQLQAKLEYLLQQLARTQSTKVESVVTEKPHQLEFFDVSFTGVYFIKNGTILPASAGQKLVSTDQTLFDLFKGIVGETALSTFFKEWRTFNNDDGDLGGFVELIPKEKRWVIGVNQADYEYSNEDSTEAYISLFIHEYAHVLLYEKPELVALYKKQFWTKADIANQKKLTRLSGDAHFEASLAYYEQNSDRFVSDYATVSPDEDMAESFVAFILEEKEEEITTAFTKQNFFYMDPDLVQVRDLLRKNLDVLGYL